MFGDYYIIEPQKNKSKKRLIIILALFSVLISVGILYWSNLNKVISVFNKSKVNLVINDNYINTTYPLIIEDKEVLLPLTIIQEYIDKDILWDENLSKVIIKTQNKVVKMKTNNLTAYVNNKAVNLSISSRVVDNIIYLPFGFLSGFYNLNMTYNKKNNVVIIENKENSNKIVRSNEQVKKIIVFEGPDINSNNLEIITDLKDYKFRVFGYDENDLWYKVRTESGIIGYVESKETYYEEINMDDFVENDIANENNKIEGKIIMTWDMSFSKRYDFSDIPDMKDLDVISPTWFQLKNSKGELINRAYEEYVEWAKDRGYKVWALLSNDFNSPQMTSDFLKNSDARGNLIREILNYSIIYNLHGINIDFENFRNTDRELLVEFIREMTLLLREQGLVVSVDVSIPNSWVTPFSNQNLTQISEIVDYVMIMTYDQHWSLSPVAGSVAQLEWVENNVEKMVKYVPSEKLILGIPFYTRLWEEYVDESGAYKVSGKRALTMSDAMMYIETNKANSRWDEISGQFYYEYTKDNKTYKIWLENERSIDLRSSLVHKYNLAGVASWSRGYETPQIWSLLTRNLKEIENYKKWIASN